jgi:hypothetical protein
MEDSKDSRQSGHRDIAHPITPECREYIQGKVLDAYHDEIKKGGGTASAPKKGPMPEKPAASGPTPHTPHVEEDVDEEFEGDLEL